MMLFHKHILFFSNVDSLSDHGVLHPVSVGYSVYIFYIIIRGRQRFTLHNAATFK